MKEMKMKKRHLLTAAVVLMNLVGASAHAVDLKTRDVSATKEVKEGGHMMVKFIPTTNEIISGVQATKNPAFQLTLSDSAAHSGWAFQPSLSSLDSDNDPVMVNAAGDKVMLVSDQMHWSSGDRRWTLDDNTNAELNLVFSTKKGDAIKPGSYTFTASVTEYLN